MGKITALLRTAFYARSHAAPTQHPWDKPLLQRWQQIKDDLGDLELFGENMYGIQFELPIHNWKAIFTCLQSDAADYWLSWEEVKFYAQLFDFPTVPEIPIVQSLADFTQKYANEDIALVQWLAANLGEPWTDSVQTAGKLGGYDPKTGAACSEGFVIRNAADFATNNGNLPVQSNEFDNLFNWYEPNTLNRRSLDKPGSLPVLLITTNTIGKAGSFRRPEVQ